MGSVSLGDKAEVLGTAYHDTWVTIWTCLILFTWTLKILLYMSIMTHTYIPQF